MRRFRIGLVVVSLCAAMLAGTWKAGAIRHHSRATLNDEIITTIIKAII